jgi:predicted MFS family arabinose efflux permease
MLVPAERLARANALLTSSQLLNATLFGTFAGAALFAAGPAVPFVADTLLFAGAALLIAGLRGSFAVTGRPSATVRRDVAEGLSWLVRNRLLWTIALLSAVVNLTLAAAESVLVLYMRDRDAGGFGFAAMLGILAVGGVLGSVVAGSRRAAAAPRRLLAVAALLQGAALIVAGVSGSAAPAAFAAVGFASALWNVTTATLRQTLVPMELLGRVNSSYRLIIFSAMPAGAALGGVLTRWHGPAVVFVVAGAVLTSAALVALPALRAAAANDSATKSYVGNR